MKCELPTRDGTVCGADLLPTHKCCGNCGGKVVIDESNTKTCPECSNKSKLTENFCIGCCYSFKDGTNKTFCEDKKEDGAKYPDEKNKEVENKDQNEDLDKVQTEDLDGRDGKNRPEQETEKQIENTTQKPTSEPSAEDEEPEKRGLAVVCTHSRFIHKSHNLEPRDSASDDHAKMTSVWDSYGCHVIDFRDEQSGFYETTLIEKIKEELEKIGNIAFFVFVLSSHGEEKEETRLRTDELRTFQHYFITKGGQCNTHDLMNKIANIEKLDSKLKIFVIQACRSRAVAKDENKDLGVEIEIESEKFIDLLEDEKKDKPNDKRQNYDLDLPDAIGDYSEYDELYRHIDTLPHFEEVPHCDDCVVMFASMSGKMAYSKSNTQKNSGGWLITSVDKILQKYKRHQQVHILDILVEVNREVGTRKAEVKREMYEIPNIDLGIKMENLHPGLKNHVKKLREICSKHSSKAEINKCQDELDELAAEIDQIGHTEDSLNRIKDETVLLTEKFKQKLRYVPPKSQSSFFHNLAFDDDDLLLCKIK